MASLFLTSIVAEKVILHVSRDEEMLNDMYYKALVVLFKSVKVHRAGQKLTTRVC